MELLKENFINSTLHLDNRIDEETAIKVRRRYEKLVELAPAHSSSSLSIRYYDGYFIGRIRINSFIKNFVAHSKSHGAMNAYMMMESQIKEQFYTWKKSRFAPLTPASQAQGVVA
jgi:hypothetical protein